MSSPAPHDAFARAGLVLRPFATEQRDRVIELLRGIYAEYEQVLELDTLDSDLLDLESGYAAPKGTFQVLCDGDEVVATVAVKRKDLSEAELKRVFLHRRLRGTGLGKALVRWAVEWAGAHGVRTLHIWSDTLFDAAHQLYRRIGAEDTGLQRSLGGRNDIYEFYFRLLLPAGEAASPSRSS